MTNSLQQHGIKEVYRQLRLKMKTLGLDTVKVNVWRRAGKYHCDFTGSPEQTAQAEKVLAAWT